MAQLVDRYVDLNADLGEEVTDDEALLRIVTSANVACGYHAGNATIMAAVCERAAELGVSVGAQVSYDDRANFGRSAVDVEPDVLRDQVADQVGMLSRVAADAGTTVRYLKPHGALYHRVLDDEAQADAVLEGSGRLPVLTMPGALARFASAVGRVVWSEGFPDRAYGEGGRLVPRGRSGAVLEDVAAIVANAVDLAASVDSVCLHGDSPGAVDHARAVRRALEGPDGPFAASESPPQAVGSGCGEPPESVEVTRCSVEQAVGPEECRTFFDEPLARGRSQGIELSHRATSGKAERPDRRGFGDQTGTKIQTATSVAASAR